MRKIRGIAGLAVLAAITYCVVAVPAASAARIETNNIILRADAGFVPNLLPARSFAPIEIRAGADFSYRGSGRGRELRRMRVDLSRNGQVQTQGLPICRATRLEGTDPAQARSRCGGALVASGLVAAAVEPPQGGLLRVTSPLSVFNGPQIEGHPSVLLHAHALVPYPETYVVPVPLEQRGGRFGGFHIDVAIPEIAGGFGFLSRASVRINRRYRHRGRTLSYVSARCPNNYLGAHGRFDFADGTVIEGTLLKYCAQRPR